MDLKPLRDTPPWDWPKDAGATLLEVLRNREADDRLLAAELAGDVSIIDDGLAGQLLSLAGDPEEPEELRGEAAIALGPVLEYCDEEGFEGDDVPISEGTFRVIQGAFQALFRDVDVPKDVRRRILEASVRASEPWHADAVRDAYAGGDAEWTLTAVFCMRFVRGFEEQILDALESKRAEFRHEAVCAAGAWALQPAWPSIAPLLALGTAKPLLLSAIEAAVFVRPEDAPGLLLPLLASRDEDVVEAVHEALSMIEALDEEGGEKEEEEHKGTWH